MTNTQTDPDAVLRYADHTDGVVEVFLPAGGTGTRVVFLIHGGFWRQTYDVSTVRPLARALAGEGYVVVAPEYRRVARGGGWPTTCEDVEAAYDAVPALLESLGVRPESTVITGHSAGGHLALWLAGRRKSAAKVVPLAPVADLRDAVATRMGDGAAIDFLGTEEPVDEADPARMFDEHRPAYPVVILHGDADEPVPLANSRSLVARHPWIELHELDGVDHMAMIDPAGPVYPELLVALEV